VGATKHGIAADWTPITTGVISACITAIVYYFLKCDSAARTFNMAGHLLSRYGNLIMNY